MIYELFMLCKRHCVKCDPFHYVHALIFACLHILYFQVSALADDILKNVEFDVLRLVFNKFQSVVSFIPTMATILSPEVIRLFSVQILSVNVKLFGWLDM